ncbi:MAG TPA: hypothetical protein VIO36_09745 [Anaerolineaceae bacterium]
MSAYNPGNKPAWVQLYEARNVPANPDARPPGRPPAPVPRRKVGLTLSQGEISELEVWQERFTKLLGRKVSTGETIGILARICTARLNRVGEHDETNLVELVERLVGNA